MRTGFQAFEREKLTALAVERRDAYASADPFPHAVLDGFVDPDLLDCVLEEFPAPGDVQWWEFDDRREKKLGTRDDSAMGPTTRRFFADLNSAAMIDFLQVLTGVDGLVPDPHLFGGGLHQIERGGFLKIHADFDTHPVTSLVRRLNLIVYLNKDWEDGYGGDLELWDAAMTRCVTRIAPVFNRCVVFAMGETFFHGHPDPLACPAGRSRKSMALYYYTAPGPGGPGPAGRSTVFKERPGERLPEPDARPRSPFASNARRVAIRWLPPAVADAARQARRSLASKSSGV